MTKFVVPGAGLVLTTQTLDEVVCSVELRRQTAHGKMSSLHAAWRAWLTPARCLATE